LFLLGIDSTALTGRKDFGIVYLPPIEGHADAPFEGRLQVIQELFRRCGVAGAADACAAYLAVKGPMGSPFGKSARKVISGSYRSRWNGTKTACR